MTVITVVITTQLQQEVVDTTNSGIGRSLGVLGVCRNPTPSPFSLCIKILKKKKTS